MKKRQYITNAEKAVMVHALFTAEIPGILDLMQEQCRELEESQEELRKNWHTFIGFDFWLAIARETSSIIDRHRQELIRESEEFGNLLLDKHLYFFINHCIITYAEHTSKNEAFQDFVKKIYY